MSMRSVILVVSIVTGIVAAGFGLTALFLAIASEYGAIAAAGAISLVLLTLSAIGILVERILARRQAAQTPEGPMGVLKTAVDSNPVGTIGAVAGLGFLVARNPAVAARAARHLATLLV